MTKPESHIFTGGITGRSNGSPEGNEFMRLMIQAEKDQKEAWARTVANLKDRGADQVVVWDGWFKPQTQSTATFQNVYHGAGGMKEGETLAVVYRNRAVYFFRVDRIEVTPWTKSEVLHLVLTHAEDLE